MKGGAKEYLAGEASADPRHLAAERRAKIKNLFDRAWLALRERRISRGAFTMLRWMVDWAKEHGDGDSFSLGERHMQELTLWDRKTIRAYRWQLAVAGLLDFRQKWAFKRGWFYEGKWTLLFASASGGIFPPDSGGKNPPESGGIIPPYLIRKRLVASTKLCPPGGICADAKDYRAADADGSGLDSSHGDATSQATADGSAAKLPLRSGTGVSKEAASKVPSPKAAVPEATRRELMGLCRGAMKEAFTNDAGKWSGRIQRGPKQAALVRRCANDLAQANRTGKPIRKSRGGYMEDLWQRWRPNDGPDWK